MANRPLLYLQPSLEIHLARSHTRTSSQQLFLTHRNATPAAQARGWDYELDPVLFTASDVMITAAAGSSLLVEYDSLFKVVQIIPGSTGTGTNVLSITFPGGPIVANVHVHERFNDWWFGIDSITVPRSDITDPALPATLAVNTAQVTIYGQFDADPAVPNSIGVVADITGHDIVDLHSSDSSIVSVDFRYNCWLQGNALGTANINGRFDGGTLRSIPATVVNWFGLPTTLGNFDTISEPNAILQLVGPRRGDPDEMPNLLFLSEGFLASEQPLFDRAVEEIKTRIFSAPRFKPFSYLREDVNVWKAFIPSANQGVNQRVTRTTTVDTANGFAISMGSGTEVLIQERDTFFGFLTPNRPSDNIYSNTHHVVGDSRRYPLQLNWARAIVQFLATLAESGNPVNRVGRHWFGYREQRGKDAGLVVILFNERLIINQEANYGYFAPISLTLPTRGSFNLSPTRPVVVGAADQFVWKVGRTVTPYSTPALITANLTSNVVDDLADVTTHELGHSLVLGDEYEGDDHEIDTFSDARFDNLSFWQNIHAGTSVTPPQIDPSKLKWAGLFRIQRSARIKSAAWNHTNLNAITLTLEIRARTGVTWTAGDTVFIREFAQTYWEVPAGYGGVNLDFPFHGMIPLPTEDPRVEIIDVTLATVSTTSGITTVTINIPKVKFPVAWQTLADADFRTRIDGIGLQAGVLFVPKTSGGTVMKLIDDEIMTFMTSSHAPLTTNFDAATNTCGVASHGQVSPPATITALTHRRLPALAFRVIGAYEGGNHASCQVYRPTGMCRMRSEGFNGPFCYVCQYLIVTRLNPSRLAELEADYPEFRT